MHPAIYSLLCYMIFNAIVSGMPEPVAASGVGYQWLYKTLHLLALNLDKLWAAKGLPMLPTPPAGQTIAASQTAQNPDGSTQTTTAVATGPAAGKA